MTEQIWWIIGIAAYWVIGMATWEYVRKRAIIGMKPVQVGIMYVLTIIFWFPLLVYLILKGR